MSMRWWLALAFAGIAALTAIAVAQVFGARSEAAIRERARDLTAGSAVTAALEISNATSVEEIRSMVADLAASRAVSLFVLDAKGSFVTPERSHGFAVRALPNFAELRSTALQGRRTVETIDHGRLVTAALPLRGNNPGALIAVARRPDLEAALGIVQKEIVRAALWAVAISAVVGLVVALLITRRIRRVGAAAARIEQGNFDHPLEPLFPDELGELAVTIDSMRRRLRTSFEELEGERDRLERLLEQLQEGVIAVDRELTVEFANSRAHQLVGSTVARGEQLPDPWPLFSFREAASSMFEPSATAHTMHVRPVSDRTYAITLLPPRAAASTGVVVLTDVSERERRERAEREFVTNAAHELRTPLAAIASAVEVLQGGAKEQPADRDRFLEVVERQTTRLTNLAQALLTLARAQTRAESIRLEPVPLVPMLSEIAENLGDAEISVSVDAHATDSVALAHRELLRQALENLAENALKHASGGRLTFRVVEEDGHVRIDVADEGPGIRATDVERVFDRFYRADGSEVDGFGIGLAIVREAIAGMEGTLSIESRPGTGTTVSIVLRSVTNGRARA